MSQIKRIGIDTSKAVFTLHCVDDTGRAVLQTNLRRAQMVVFFKKLPPTEIVMEACGSSHHWGRELGALGHDVRLIPPQYVKPFVRSGLVLTGASTVSRLKWSEAPGLAGSWFFPRSDNTAATWHRKAGTPSVPDAGHPNGAAAKKAG